MKLIPYKKKGILTVVGVVVLDWPLNNEIIASTEQFLIPVSVRDSFWYTIIDIPT